MSRKIVVECVKPPIPIREFDWCATFAGYEPGEPQGYGATKQAAIDDLMSKADDDAPATPAAAEPTPFGKTPQQHLDDAVKWLDTRRDRLHHEGCSVHEPSARCNCGLHKTLTDVRAVRNWLESQTAATPAARDVLAERERQKTAEGWTPEHDDEHIGEELARAAGCYALGQPIRWPWTETHPLMGVMAHHGWKPKDRRSNLVRAGALILAEIERLDRKAANKHPTPHQ